MLDIAGNLLSIPIKVLDLVRGVKSIRRDRANGIADLFERISEALAQAGAEIREGRIPHGVCEQIMTFAGEFEPTTKGTLPEEKARELSQQLYENYNVEMMAAKLDPASQDERDVYAQKLEESSGRFRALAYLIKARAA